jgi:hypothetical protein
MHEWDAIIRGSEVVVLDCAVRGADFRFAASAPLFSQ